MRSKAWLVALALAVLARPASAATVFVDDMEGETGGWTATGMWHRVAGAEACASAHGGTASWYYGRAPGCTFDDGATNRGTLTSPAFTVPRGAVAILDFWSSYETETSGTSWDQRVVQVSMDGGDFVNVEQLSGDPMLTWRLATVDLSRYGGHSLRLRFSFDTRDSVSNAYRGWYVDDVRVTVTGGGYSAAPPTSSWIDIASPANDARIACDDCQATRPIGFPFTFYGPTYAEVNVSSNGYVTFEGPATSYVNQDIPTASSPNAFAAPFWDDLYVAGAARVYVATVGTAPSRRLVVTWEAVDYCCSVGSGPLTFQLVVSEADQSILFQYADVDATSDRIRGLGGSATVGLENQTGTAGVRHSFGDAVLSDGLALRFLPDDSDGDGLPDFWEGRFGTHPNSAASPAAGEDVDGDGLDWLEEYHAGASPFAADTDGDGLTDAEEVAGGTNPIVPDAAPTVLVTLSGPGTSHGAASFRFTTTGSMSGTTGFRVYYGAAPGFTASDYPAHVDLVDPAARSGIVDRTWGLQGVPMVYFRVAPVRAVAGRVLVGALSNEHAAYFAGASPKERVAGTAATTTERSSPGCSSGGAGVLGLLGLGAAALASRWRGPRRRGAAAG